MNEDDYILKEQVAHEELETKKLDRWVHAIHIVFIPCALVLAPTHPNWSASIVTLLTLWNGFKFVQMDNRLEYLSTKYGKGLWTVWTFKGWKAKR